MVQRRRSRGPSGQSNRQETINSSRVATISTRGLSALPTREHRGASAEDRFLAACKTLASQPFLGAGPSSRISPPRQALSVLNVSPQPAAIRWPSACAKKFQNPKKAASKKTCPRSRARGPARRRPPIKRKTHYRRRRRARRGASGSRPASHNRSRHHQGGNKRS